MSFTKLDSGILDSSIWDEDSNVLKTFIAFWTKSDSEGNVDATYNAMVRSANLCDKSKNPLPVSEFERCLNVLMSPDHTSKSESHEGRRIIRVSESRWFIVNYKHYRTSTYSDNPDAIRKREYRKSGTSWDMSQSVLGHSASISASKSGGKKECRERKPFVVPTIEEVSAYCKERGNSVNPQRFWDYYQSQGWKVAKNPMKDWRAAVRTWEQREQTAPSMPAKSKMWQAPEVRE